MAAFADFSFEDLYLVGTRGLPVSVEATIAYNVSGGRRDAYLSWSVDTLASDEPIPSTDPLFARIAAALREQRRDDIEATLWEYYAEAA